MSNTTLDSKIPLVYILFCGLVLVSKKITVDTYLITFGLYLILLRIEGK
jgi:hypothetical protein